MIIFEVNERYDIETDFYYYRAEVHLLEVMNAFSREIDADDSAEYDCEKYKDEIKGNSKGFCQTF